MLIIEKVAFRNHYSRLNQFLRRFGIVYIDGLTYTNNQELSRLFEAGLKFAEHGNWGKALDRWEAAKDKASDTELIALHLLCGGCQVFKQNIELAEQEFAQGLKIARKVGSITGTAAACFLAAQIALDKSDRKKAQQLLKETIRHSRMVKNANLEAKSLTILAKSLLQENDVETALAYHRNALRLLEDSGDHRAAINQYIAIGDILFNQGDLDRARAAYEDGLHLSRQIRNRAGEAEHLAAIGVIHRAQRDYKRAINALDRALQIFRELNFLRGQARVLYELGLTYQHTDSPEIAGEFYEQGLTFARRINDRKLISRNLLGLAVNCIVNQNYQRAQTLIEEAITMDQELLSKEKPGGELILSGPLEVLKNGPPEGVAILKAVEDLSRRGVVPAANEK
ncbi:MAG: tetratricopeptide repeat protein [bacterium]